MPIETQISGQEIDGTGRWVGQEARVGQMPTGEVITCERSRGIRCGCRHFVYSVQERVTDTGTLAGIGGVCHYCGIEADQLVQRGALSASQAEVASLYCSQCASHCDGCGRRNLCTRHTRPFQDADGRPLQLCPDCLKSAQSKRLFKRTLTTIAYLFAEDDTSAPSKPPGGRYGR